MSDGVDGLDALLERASKRAKRVEKRIADGAGRTEDPSRTDKVLRKGLLVFSAGWLDSSRVAQESNPSQDAHDS